MQRKNTTKTQNKIKFNRVSILTERVIFQLLESTIKSFTLRAINKQVVGSFLV
jgi:hypothetical protein